MGGCSSSKVVWNTNILYKIVQNKSIQGLCSQDVQKYEIHGKLCTDISEQIGYVNIFHCKTYDIEYRSKVTIQIEMCCKYKIYNRFWNLVLKNVKYLNNYIEYVKMIVFLHIGLDKMY